MLVNTRIANSKLVLCVLRLEASGIIRAIFLDSISNLNFCSLAALLSVSSWQDGFPRSRAHYIGLAELGFDTFSRGGFFFFFWFGDSSFMRVDFL